MLFTSVGAAVAAALDVNERLAAEHWPAGERVVVRSAMHVGEVTATDEGLFGLEVHRCARLRALADGGEVFLSDAAVRQVALQLPQRSSVTDEGVVLLRGFAQPERVWRLVHPALSPRRRPLVGASDLAGALPEWRTSLVGRSAEVAAIGDRLVAGQIVTLVGPAGVGKTRLAVAAARSAAWPVRFVDLTLATSGDDVPAVAAEAMGVEESASFLAGIETALERNAGAGRAGQLRARARRCCLARRPRLGAMPGVVRSWRPAVHRSACPGRRWSRSRRCRPDLAGQRRSCSWTGGGQ